MRQKKTIIYVNFAPYENAGRILDYLLNTFSLVILLSFDFHNLNNNSQSNRLRIYQNGQIKKEIQLYKLPTPENLLFISLPLIALLIGIQTLWYIRKFKIQYGKFDYYLTVNAFTACVGILLRKISYVDKTIFWVWDYYPPGYPDFRIRSARWFYWKFDTLSTSYSNSIIFLNKKLETLRKQINVLPINKKYKIVPIGTNPKKYSFSSSLIIGHIGVLKRSQGLDIVFDTLPELLRIYPKLQVQIIGSGPDEEYFKKRTRRLKQIIFYGFVKEEDIVDKIMQKWSMGIATYIPEKSNESYWTDPSKIKAYISQGIPVITTNVTDFSKVLQHHQAGLIIDYSDKKSFIAAVKELYRNQRKYKQNAFSLAKEYDYRKLYSYLFQ